MQLALANLTTNKQMSTLNVRLFLMCLIQTHAVNSTNCPDDSLASIAAI